MVASVVVHLDFVWLTIIIVFCVQGQVPPYAQGQITRFAVQEAIIKTVESAMEAYKVGAISGSDGQLEVLEDVEAMSKQYKVGDPLQSL